MTTRDQKAMNEQLTQLRQEGLSIDGDNRYKDDLIDVAIGAMLRGFQAGQEPPEGHWAWRFYEIGKAEQEALARVEAERDTAIVQMQNIRKGRDAINKELGDTEFKLCIAHSQLAEAVGLIEKSADLAGELGDYLVSLAKRHSGTELLDHERYLRDFLSRQTPAEQQDTQGAQAGGFQREDRYMVIKRKDLALLSPTDRDLALTLMGELSTIMETWSTPKRQYVVVEDNWPEFEPTWAAIQARVEGRAAVATQPAESAPVEAMNFEYVDLSGERRTVTITRDEVIEGMEDALYEKLGDQICRCEPIGETHVVDCNCQDYIEQFTLVKPHSSLPNGSVYAVRGAEHE